MPDMILEKLNEMGATQPLVCGRAPSTCVKFECPNAFHAWTR